MDGKRDKTSCIRIPIFCGIIFSKNLPEGKGFIRAIAGGEEIDGVKITRKIDDERPQQSSENGMT